MNSGIAAPTVCSAQGMYGFSIEQIVGSFVFCKNKTTVCQSGRELGVCGPTLSLHCVCPLLCIVGQTSCFNKTFVRCCVRVCAAVPGSYLRLLAGFPVSLVPAVRLARAPASVRTSPSDLCEVPGDLWVVCTRCLSALQNAPPHVREGCRWLVC